MRNIGSRVWKREMQSKKGSLESDLSFPLLIEPFDMDDDITRLSGGGGGAQGFWRTDGL